VYSIYTATSPVPSRCSGRRAAERQLSCWSSVPRVWSVRTDGGSHSTELLRSSLTGPAGWAPALGPSACGHMLFERLCNGAASPDLHFDACVRSGCRQGRLCSGSFPPAFLISHLASLPYRGEFRFPNMEPCKLQFHLVKFICM
jgi:hypothetical protein